MAPKGKSLPSWNCAICGITDNWGSKARCRVCEAYPPEEHRRLVKANYKGGKGGGGGGNAKGEQKGKGPGSTINFYNSGNKYGNFGTFAYRQMQKVREDEKFNQARTAFNSSLQRYQDAQRRADNLVEQNKKLLRELSEAKASSTKTKEDWDDMEEGPEEMSEEDRKARIDKVRAGLPYLEEQFGIDSEVHQGALEELEMHQRALREAKPYKTHRTILERRVEKLRRLQDRDRAKLAELQEAAEEIHSKVSSTAAAVSDREREIEATETELKELVLRAVGEEAGTNQQSPIDPHRGWASVVGTVAQLVQQPGVPQHVATQIEGVLGQLQGMVSALQAHAASIQAPAQTNPIASTTPVGKPGPPAAAAATSISPSITTAAASSSSSAARQNEDVAEDARRVQQAERTAWRQRKSQEAIMEYERAYRLVQAVEGPKPVIEQGDQLAHQTLPNPPPPRPPSQVMPTSEDERREMGNVNNDSSQNDGRGTTSTPQSPVDNGMGNSTSTTDHPIEVAAAAASAAAAAAAEAAATAVANTSPSAGGDTGGNTAGVRGAGAASEPESDITGTISEGERERMEVDELVDKIPAEQRAGVKALLEKRRARKVRQLQRHKKPEGDGLGSGTARDAKRR